MIQYDIYGSIDHKNLIKKNIIHLYGKKRNKTSWPGLDLAFPVQYVDTFKGVYIKSDKAGQERQQCSLFQSISFNEEERSC